MNRRAVREQLEAAREGLQDILPLAIVQVRGDEHKATMRTCSIRPPSPN